MNGTERASTMPFVHGQCREHRPFLRLRHSGKPRDLGRKNGRGSEHIYRVHVVFCVCNVLFISTLLRPESRFIDCPAWLGRNADSDRTYCSINSTLGRQV